MKITCVPFLGMNGATYKFFSLVSKRDQYLSRHTIARALMWDGGRRLTTNFSDLLIYMLLVPGLAPLDRKPPAEYSQNNVPMNAINVFDILYFFLEDVYYLFLQHAQLDNSLKPYLH